MKKYFPLLVLVTLQISSLAQDLKGAFVTGSLNVRSFDRTMQNSSQSNSAGASYSFNPSLGSMVSNTLAFGVSGSYSYAEYPLSTEDMYGYSIPIGGHMYGIGPFMRNFAHLTEKFAFFSQASAMYSIGSQQISMGSGYYSNGKLNTIALGLSPGFMYRPTPKVSIEFNVRGASYKRYAFKEGSRESALHLYGFDLGLNEVTVGLSLYLARQTEPSQ